MHCSELMSETCGGSAKQAGLDGYVIQPTKLRDIAVKKVSPIR